MEKDIPILRILHFNDTYDIQPSKKNNAGAYYFKAYLEKYRTQNSLTLFSGDAFSPSVLSRIFEGEQMVHCLNTMGVDVACYGNHEFDYDIDHTIGLATKCNFPWLMGNLLDLRTGKPLGDGKESMIFQKNGLTIGLFGVAEEEWITLLTQDYQGQLQYIDFVKYSRYITKQLKKIYKCDIVIALTHMRVPNDQKLAQEVPDIDFILGGHDHSIHNQIIGTTHIIKSGCNFNYLSVIDLYPKSKQTQYKGKNYNQTHLLVPVTAVEEYDKQLKQYVDSKLKVYQEQSEKVIGYTLVPLETRFEIIRTQETNYGNFITDLIKAFYNIDAVILQSGSIRNDAILEPGPLKYSTINNIFEMFLIVKFVPGNIINDILQHSVSKYPTFEGRFLLVSGIRFTFDANKQPYNRVDKSKTTINGFPVKDDKIYKIGMPQYIGQGGDGYLMLGTCKQYIQTQNATTLMTLLMRFYHPLEFRKSTTSPQLNLEQLQFKALTLNRHQSSKQQRLSRYVKKIQQIDGRYVVFIEPQLDGRINVLNPKTNNLTTQ